MKLVSRFVLSTIGGILLGVLLLAGRVAGNPTEDAKQELKEEKLQVLVVTGGHGYDRENFDRMFKAYGDIESQHLKHPVALDVMTSSDVGKFDAVVLYDMHQKITDTQKEAYAAMIRGGKGVVVLHHAVANFQNWPEYERIIGGKFFLGAHKENGVEKPSSGYRHGVDIPVEIADPDHFITRGLENFVIHDEVYSRCRVDPAVHVLLKTRHPESGPVIGWVKPYGKGRVAYLQLGHDKHAYSNPNYAELVSRSIRWVARRTPEDALFTPLFNGKDLRGWKAEGKARFAVENGILVGRQGPRGEAGDLYSEAKYGDFELEVTWATTWPGNSGVWFRYVNGRKAYQADILEWKKPVCWSGSVYCSGKMFISMNEDPSIVRRDGWNTFLIRAKKNHIVVFLNGHKVSDVEDDTSSRGRIGFQVHAGKDFSGMEIRIADVRIRPLD